MITLLQKYQRGLTLAITLCVASTFIFFGTSRAFLPTEEKSLQEVVWSQGGAKLTRGQLHARSRFLSSELASAGEQRTALSALLNPGFASRLILDTGLGRWLIEQDPATQQWIKERYAREKVWRGYRHPQMQWLSFDQLLMQFNPGFITALRQWQSSTPEEMVQAKIELWQRARHLPFHALASVVRYQERADRIESDPHFDPSMMLPFGYSDLNEWFGPRFGQLCTQLVALGAKKAEQLGYRVSDREAELAVESRIEQIWQQLQEPGSSFARFQQQLLHAVGMSKAQLHAFWRDLMLFEALCYHEGSRYWADPVLCQTVASFASDRVEAELYELPQPYQLSSLEQMAFLQLYWHMTSGLSLDDPGVPDEIAPTSELLQRAPELISKRVKLGVRHMTLDKIRVAFGAKELLRLQAQEPLWNELKARYASLGERATLAERLEALALLPAAERRGCDQMAIEQMARAGSQPLRALLQAQPLREQELSFMMAATRQPLEGIASAHELFQQLRQHPMLEAYTQDGYNYYTLAQLGDVEQELIGFEQASQSGILEAVLLRHLQTRYQELKAARSKLIVQEGKVQEFAKVQEMLLRDWLQPLLSRLAKQRAGATGGAAESSTHPESLLAWRFWSYLTQQKELLLQGKIPATDLPWSLVRSERPVTRERSEAGSLNALFHLKPGEWLELLQGGQPTGRIVRCLEQCPGKANAFALSDKLYPLYAKQLNRAALLEWAKGVQLDLQLDLGRE